MKALHEIPATELAAAIAKRELSPVELVDHYLARIEDLDPRLHAFVFLDADQVRRDAKVAEKRVGQGEALGLLHGLPVPVKDLILTKGIQTTRGSQFFRNDVPTEDAPVVERLRAAGALVFGKTNTSEFGWKGATSNRLFPETLNPWDLTRSPGGSSGGAAAIVASGLAPVALGTDGGGSVRIPAAFTGIFGFKPSLGRWPVFPPSAFGPLSHAGPMTRTVDDAALLFRALSGPDERDVYSLPAELFETEIKPANKLRIGWSPDLGFMPVTPEVRQIAEAAVRRFEAAGCEIVPLKIDIGDPTKTVATYFSAGIGAAVAWQPNWRELVDPGIVPLVEAGTKLTGTDFAAAQVARAVFAQKIAAATVHVDILATPTVPVLAFPAGQDGPGEINGVAVDPVRWLGLTSLFNLTGQPAASVPAGLGSGGLPVGLQLVGPRFQDWLVLRASKTFEQISRWPEDWPVLAQRGPQ